MRNNKGVTLVALVITIIVLLILAGVALAMLTGDSGILTNADEAKKETALANAKSSVEMAYMDIKTEVYAREAKETTAQAISLTSTEMVDIVKRYITTTEASINGTGSITGVVDDTDTVYVTIDFDDVNIDTEATITYDPTPETGHPRVELEWSIAQSE